MIPTKEEVKPSVWIDRMIERVARVARSGEVGLIPQEKVAHTTILYYLDQLYKLNPEIKFPKFPVNDDE